MGVPIKLLHEGEGHGVTVEMKNGEIYRGHLNEAEDTMNCFMTGGETMLSNFVFAALQAVLRGTSIHAGAVYIHLRASKPTSLGSPQHVLYVYRYDMMYTWYMIS